VPATESGRPGHRPRIVATAVRGARPVRNTDRRRLGYGPTRSEAGRAGHRTAVGRVHPRTPAGTGSDRPGRGRSRSHHRMAPIGMTFERVFVIRSI
jgi:hypothetical protein